MKDRRLGVAALFTAIGIVELAALNFIFSPGYIWFYYGAYALLWWPLAVCFYPRRSPHMFALAGSAMTAVFLAAVNLQNTPWNPWFLYAVYPLVLWPVAVYFIRHGKHKAVSLWGSISSVAYLIALNCLLSPGHPWWMYACCPLLWWPVAVYMGRRAGALWFAWLVSAVTVAYYALLNVLVSPGFPWAICPAFAILWWPISIFFARRRAWVGYALAGSGLTIAFLFVVNIAASPGYLWALYPAFALLWWPMTMVFAKHKAWTGYSVAAALLTIAGFTALNITASPGAVWAIYPAFAVLWWPMTMLFSRRKSWVGYAVAGAALASIFFIIVNYLTSPGTVWAIYPIFAVIWWPLSMVFAKHRCGYAVAASVLISMFAIVLNLLLSSGTVWAIYPIFAIVWWPLSLLFARRKNKMGFAIAGAALISLFFAAVNLLYTPRVLWAVYPIFTVAWWPLSLYFFKYRRMKAAG